MSAIHAKRELTVLVCGFFLKEGYDLEGEIDFGANLLECQDSGIYRSNLVPTTFFSVLVFLFVIYGEFTQITINLFQSLKCLRT